MTPQGFPLVIKDANDACWLVVGWEGWTPIVVPSAPGRSTTGCQRFKGTFQVVRVGLTASA